MRNRLRLRSNEAPQPTANPLRGLSAAELGRSCGRESVVHEERSLQAIDEHDLRRLVRLALDDLEDLYRRKHHIRDMCKGKLLCLALCQGAALHYLDQATGVKDFDVWSFFERTGTGQFPYRRRAEVDFGSPKFGLTPGFPNFVGRKVDLLGRSISVSPDESPLVSLSRYISEATTSTPRHLAEKAGVILHPDEYFGQILWCGSAA